MDILTDTLSVVLLRGVKRHGKEHRAGETIEVPRAEYEGARPGIYALPGSIVDPAQEAAKAKSARDEADRAEKLRRLDAQRAYKAAEAERTAAFLRQHQTAQEAQAVRKTEAEALLAERRAAKKSRAQSAQAQV